MNARAGIEVDKATFYRFIERQAEGKFEFDRGSIVQQATGGTFDHARIITDFVVTLRALLSRSHWEVTSQSRAVVTGETVRNPDVLVEAKGAGGKGLATSQPVLIVEVLSPGTAELDLTIKPSEYMSLRDLQVYIVASQDRPEVKVWRSGADGCFPAEPVTISGRGATIPTGALGTAIPLSDIYSDQ